MPRPLQALVIGPSSAGRETLRVAEDIGRLLAARGITLVTGGRGGVMEAASRGAHQVGGLVVGILPGAGLEGANPWCTVVIPTGLGHARNAVNALAGDLVIFDSTGRRELCRINHVPLLPLVRKRINRILETTAITAGEIEDEGGEVDESSPVH